MQQSEPTVLDYVKSLLPWSRQQVELPAPEPPLEAAAASAQPTELAIAAPWRSLLALGSALIGQVLLEPPRGAVALGIAFYILSLALLLWAALRDEWTLAPLAESVEGNDPLTVRWIPFGIAAVLLVPVFILLGGANLAPGVPLPAWIVAALPLQENLYTWYNFPLWLLLVAVFIWSLWLSRAGVQSLWSRLRGFFAQLNWRG